MSQIFWSPGVTIEAMEKHVILAAFSFYRSVKTTTANSLGISVRTLEAKLEKYEKAKKESEVDSGKHAERHRQELHYARFGGRPTVAVAKTAKKPDAGKNGPSPNEGIRTQPAASVSEKQPVPMPEREKVQTVLPRQASASGSRKGG